MRRATIFGLSWFGVVVFALAVVSLKPVALAQKKPDPQPVEKTKGFELRIIRLGNSFQAIRFNVSTGESWVMAGEKYDKIPETGPVPVGNYEVIMVADDANWMAFRIDRQSGTTWQLRGNKWLKLKEPGEVSP